MNDEMREFLKTELSDLCSSAEDSDPETTAYLFAMTMASVTKEIDEGFLREIMVPCVCLSDECVRLYMGAFIGMGLLRVRCECVEYSDCLVVSYINHTGFALGVKFKLDNSPEYKDAANRVANLRLELEHI